MAGRLELDIDELRKRLSYDAEAGVLTWRPRETLTRQNRSWNTRFAGKSAGSFNRGYRRIYINGQDLMAHRVAWAIVNGYWPSDDLDHIDGDPSNNRLSNLREATHAENQQNRTRHADNTSGFMGVSWHDRDRKWHAQIRVAGKKRYLGSFDCPEQAHAAYLAAKAQHHTFNPVPRDQQQAAPT
jgi:hypothetical protein